MSLSCKKKHCTKWPWRTVYTEIGQGPPNCEQTRSLFALFKPKCANNERFRLNEQRIIWTVHSEQCERARGTWTVQKGESGQSVESGRSRVKVDSLLTKRRRSFRTWAVSWRKVDVLRVNWAVLLKRSSILNSSAGKWTVQKLKVNCPKDEG